MPPGLELGGLLTGINISALAGADVVTYYGLAPGRCPMSKSGCSPRWGSRLCDPRCRLDGRPREPRREREFRVQCTGYRNRRTDA